MVQRCLQKLLQITQTVAVLRQARVKQFLKRLRRRESVSGDVVLVVVFHVLQYTGKEGVDEILKLFPF